MKTLPWTLMKTLMIAFIVFDDLELMSSFEGEGATGVGAQSWPTETIWRAFERSTVTNTSEWYYLTVSLELNTGQSERLIWRELWSSTTANAKWSDSCSKLRKVKAGDWFDGCLKLNKTQRQWISARLRLNNGQHNWLVWRALTAQQWRWWMRVYRRKSLWDWLGRGPVTQRKRFQSEASDLTGAWTSMTINREWFDGRGIQKGVLNFNYGQTRVVWREITWKNSTKNG